MQTPAPPPIFLGLRAYWDHWDCPLRIVICLGLLFRHQQIWKHFSELPCMFLPPVVSLESCTWQSKVGKCEGTGPLVFGIVFWNTNDIASRWRGHLELETWCVRVWTVWTKLALKHANTVPSCTALRQALATDCSTKLGTPACLPKTWLIHEPGKDLSYDCDDTYANSELCKSTLSGQRFRFWICTSSTRWNRTLWRSRVWGSRAWNLKSDIWNLKSEIWNLKSEIRNPKSEIWSLKSEIWNLKAEIWNLKSEIWILKSETWNLKSEIWNLKSEIWNLKSEIWNLRSEIWNLKS